MTRIVFVLCLVVATHAAADTPDDPAEAAYREGRRLYDLREWDLAIAKFREAYRLRPDAPSLYNIAQSYRLKRDCMEALGFYKTYKRNYPDAPNLEQVDKFITELQPCADQAAAAKANQNPTPKSVAVAPVEPQPAPAPSRVDTRRRTLGLVVTGAGVAALGGGFVLGALARSRANEVETGGDRTNPVPFDRSLEDSGKRFDLLAKIAWGAGGAAIIGGVVLMATGKRADARIGVVPQSGGAVLVWGTRM